MLDLVKGWLLRALRVPADPRLPAGDPASARVFRAGRNFWRLKIAWWMVHQAFTFAFFVVTVVALHAVPENVRFGANRKKPPVEVHLGYVVVVVRVLEMASWSLWLLQMPLTFAIARLDYEMRWYVVTDRAARLRHGILRVTEMTFTLANVQDISITQGPLQRLLGLANVEMRTAGGAEAVDAHDVLRGLHLALFKGVDNAEEIRDLVRERTRHARGAGLGDPDDRGDLEAVRAGEPAITSAVQELARESTALREAALRLVRGPTA